MDEITLDDIIEVLEDVREDIDYEEETALIDDGILDSFDILSTISALNEEFDIQIPAKDIVAENFNSARRAHRHARRGRLIRHAGLCALGDRRAPGLAYL